MFRKVSLIFLMAIAAISTQVSADELDDIELSHETVPPDVLDAARAYSSEDDARRHAVCFNPVRKWFTGEVKEENDRYEFLLTPEGEVIYQRNDGGWKFFPKQGVDIFSSREGEPKTIGFVEMIAADGNRVMIKTSDDELYAADLAPEELHEEARKVYRQFVIRDPEWTTEEGFPPSKSEEEIIEAIDKTHSFYGYSRLLPGAWNVILEEKTFVWISIRPLYDVFTKEDTENEIVLDIGVINLHKSMMSQNDQNGYRYAFGGEYHTRQPFFRDEVENKDYGNFSDGITNFYVLTYDPTRDVDNLNIRYIDEQYIFSSDWYYYFIHKADVFTLIDDLSDTLSSPTLTARLQEIADNTNRNSFDPLAIVDEIKTRLLNSDILDENGRYFLSGAGDDDIALLKDRMGHLSEGETDFVDMALKITSTYARVRTYMDQLAAYQREIRSLDDKIRSLNSSIGSVQWWEFWRWGDLARWIAELSSAQARQAACLIQSASLGYKIVQEYCNLTGENPLEMAWNYVTDAKVREESDRVNNLLQRIDRAMYHLAFAENMNAVIDTVIDVLEENRVNDNPAGARLCAFLEMCKLDHDAHNDPNTILNLDRLVAISADLLTRKKSNTFTSVADINATLQKYGVDIAAKIKGIDLVSAPSVIDFSGRWRAIQPEAFPPMFSADQNLLNGQKYHAEDPETWTDPRLALWWQPALTLNSTMGDYIESNDFGAMDPTIAEQIPTIDAAIENIVLSTDTELYSINWTFGSSDFTWRSRMKPQSATDGTYVRLRRDMTLLVKGSRDGVDGYYYQQLYPFGSIIGDDSGDAFFIDYYGGLNRLLNDCFPECMSDPDALVCFDLVYELEAFAAKYPLHPIPNGEEAIINSEWYFISSSDFEIADRKQTFEWQSETADLVSPLAE